MLYGSLNNWKCASTYFSMHRFHSIRCTFFFFSQPFLYVYLEHRLYEKICFILNEKTKKTTTEQMFGSRSSGFKYILCEELVMVHDDVHTAISKRILWNISSRWYVHSPYNREKGHFEIQLAIRRFTSHYQCHLCAFCFDVWCVCVCPFSAMLWMASFCTRPYSLYKMIF